MSRLLGAELDPATGAAPPAPSPRLDADGGAEAGISSVEGVICRNASPALSTRRPYARVVAVGLKV